eukprot:334164_1
MGCFESKAQYERLPSEDPIYSTDLTSLRKQSNKGGSNAGTLKVSLLDSSEDITNTQTPKLSLLSPSQPQLTSQRKPSQASESSQSRKSSILELRKISQSNKPSKQTQTKLSKPSDASQPRKPSILEPIAQIFRKISQPRKPSRRTQSRKPSKHRKPSKPVKPTKLDIYVVGNNEYSELAFNHKQCKSFTDLTKLNWPQMKSVKDIHCGNYFNVYCGDTQSQSYWICGLNDNGQCGIESNLASIDKLWSINYFERQNIKIQQVCCNTAGRCMFWITEQNEIYGHGHCEYYQLGVGTKKHQLTPVVITIPVEKDEKIISIKCAEKYSIALSSDGNVYYTGDLCHGNYYDKTWVKMDIFANKQIIKIATGYNHSLFLQDNGTLWSVGLNYNGQIGLGNFTCEKTTIPTPVQYFVNEDIKVKDMKCGLYHNLVVDEEDKIYAWGYNGEGQCGDGRTEHIHTPQLIDCLREYDIENIECGALHSYCSTFDDEHFLWGSNEYNECLASDDDMEQVTIPNAIDAIVEKETKGKTIHKVSMGWDNTIITVY